MTIIDSVCIYSCFQAAEAVVAEGVVLGNAAGTEPAGLPDVAVVVTAAAVVGSCKGRVRGDKGGGRGGGGGGGVGGIFEFLGKKGPARVGNAVLPAQPSFFIIGIIDLLVKVAAAAAAMQVSGNLLAQFVVLVCSKGDFIRFVYFQLSFSDLPWWS